MRVYIVCCIYKLPLPRTRVRRKGLGCPSELLSERLKPFGRGSGVRRAAGLNANGEVGIWDYKERFRPGKPRRQPGLAARRRSLGRINPVHAPGVPPAATGAGWQPVRPLSAQNPLLRAARPAPLCAPPPPPLTPPPAM